MQSGQSNHTALAQRRSSSSSSKSGFRQLQFSAVANRAMRSLTAKRTYCWQYGHFELSEKIADSSPHKNRVPGGGKKQGQSFRIWPLEEERISGTVLLAQTVTGTFGAHSRRSRTMHVTPPSTRKKKITCIGAVYPPVVCFNQPESSGLTIPAMLVETF